MEGVDAKLDRLKAAIKSLENLGGVGRFALQRKVIRERKIGLYTERWESWGTVCTAYIGRAYANHRVARALMVAAGLDPDGKDGVRIQTDDSGKIRF